MIRFSTFILEATTDDVFGCAHLFSLKGTASSQSDTMIGSQVGEPNENKLIIEDERSTAHSFKSLASQKDGILACLLTAEKQATRGPNVTLDGNGGRFHSQRFATINATPGYGNGKSDLGIRISRVLGGAS
jgi:hypothetical protein